MMKNRTMKFLAAAALSLGLLTSTAGFAATPSTQNASQAAPNETLLREVQHHLRMLNYYTVFDNLEFSVEGDRVILAGEVTRPEVKSEAIAVVKKIQGVSDVQDNIKVLPLSNDDDRIRRAAYRSIYGDPQLSKYGFQSVQSIHIIVDNGHITLEGFVDSQADKNVAGIRSNSVEGAFSSKNNLIVNGNK
jgi:hyperosmotically inducible periplasmic protein